MLLCSTDGLEALESFFKKMSPNSRPAFVMVQHLSPNYKSLIVELLSKHTEIPVNRIEDGVLVKEKALFYKTHPFKLPGKKIG